MTGRQLANIVGQIVGASVSELPSSDANGTFFYNLNIYMYIYVCVVRHAAHRKLIQFNVRNAYKIRVVQTPLASYPGGMGGEKRPGIYCYISAKL